MQNPSGGSTCELRIKSLNAPFNVIGTPGYLEYYVTHDWAEGSVTFAPHSASSKSALTATTAPKKFFSTPLETENAEKGELWTFLTAFLISAAIFAAWVVVIIFVFKKNLKYEVWILVLLGIGGAAVCTGLYFLFYWIFKKVFLPGNTYISVKDADEDPNVRSSAHYTVMALASYFAYKLFGAACQKDKEEKSEKKEKVAE